MTYVTIEGIDGAGKTTLAELLVDRLSADGLPPDAGDVVLTSEPCDELWTGRAVREAIQTDSAVRTDVLLFGADRSEHLHRVVLPALSAGRVVVSDRGHDSMYAYQVPRLVDDGVTRAEARAWLDCIYRDWNVEPDVTLWVDVPVPVAAERMSGEEKWAGRDYLERVRQHYEDRYNMDPTRIHRIDGEQEPEQVLADALGALR